MLANTDHQDEVRSSLYTGLCHWSKNCILAEHTLAALAALAASSVFPKVLDWSQCCMGLITLRAVCLHNPHISSLSTSLCRAWLKGCPGRSPGWSPGWSWVIGSCMFSLETKLSTSWVSSHWPLHVHDERSDEALLGVASEVQKTWQPDGRLVLIDLDTSWYERERVLWSYGCHFCWYLPTTFQYFGSLSNRSGMSFLFGATGRE